MEPQILWARPRGLPFIAIWSGAIADIPARFHLCDGTHDTPDLRDRFVMATIPDLVGLTSGDSAIRTTGTHTHFRDPPALDFDAYVADESTHTHASVGTDTLALVNTGLLRNTSPVPLGWAPAHTHGLFATYEPRAHTHGVVGTSDATGWTVDPKPPYYARAYIKGPATPPVGGIVMYNGDASRLMAFQTPWATLGAPLLVGDTTVTTTAAPATTPPAFPYMRVYVDNEIIGIINTYDVRRGMDGTTEADHAAGASIGLPRYAVCDGTNGTPDLLSHFVVGAGGLYTVRQDLGGGNTSVGGHSHPAGALTTDTASSLHTHPDGVALTDFVEEFGTNTVLVNAQTGYAENRHQHQWLTGSDLTLAGEHSHAVAPFTMPTASINVTYVYPSYFALVYLRRRA